VNKSSKQGIISNFIREWWWVCLFLGFSYSAYYSFSSEKSSAYQGLLARLSSLEVSRDLAFYRHEDLKLRIASQNDPYWIEMMLMKALGVVPEGQIKVHFDQ